MKIILVDDFYILSPVEIQKAQALTEYFQYSTHAIYLQDIYLTSFGMAAILKSNPKNVIRF